MSRFYGSCWLSLGVGICVSIFPVPFFSLLREGEGERDTCGQRRPREKKEETQKTKQTNP